MDRLSSEEFWASAARSSAQVQRFQAAQARRLIASGIDARVALEDAVDLLREVADVIEHRGPLDAVRGVLLARVRRFLEGV